MDIINKNREQIDLIDREIVILLNKRFDLCK